MKDSLSITDNRTDKRYELEISNGTINTLDLRTIKTSDSDFGLMGYDPGFTNTASCKSDITYLDGTNGVLEYRGYPIEQLAEQSTFLEVAYLLVHGELPTRPELQLWMHNVMHHTMLHEKTKTLMEGFHYDAHPMGMLVSTVSALSTFYSDARDVKDADTRMLQIYRLIGKVPTIAAFAYRNSQGLPYIYPDADLSFTGNFLRMIKMLSETTYSPDPVLERALDILFILHADHEQNCSTHVMRCITSSMADPFVATAGAAAALYGPLHGGANEAVLTMLREIGDVKKVPDYIKRVKDGEFRLMGFGHRVYKNYDPRARIIKEIAHQVFEVTGKNPLLDIALELERIALDDDFFIKRKLYPNIDFYSGLIYEALEIPTSMFTVLFAIPRTAGWVAQWEEMMKDSESRIARPRQIYQGQRSREFIPLEQRD